MTTPPLNAVPRGAVHPHLQRRRRPRRPRVTNDDLVEPINSSDEWIRQRTGIITRTRASAGILAIDLATRPPRSDRALRDPRREDRPGARRDHQQRAADPVDGRGRRRPRRRQPRRGLRHQRGLRRLRLRGRPGGRPDPRRRRRTTRSSSAPRSSPTSSTRPTGPSRSCSATVPAPSSSARARRPASRRTVWGSDGSKADAVGMNATLDGVPRRRRALAHPPPGRPDGLPLGRLGHGEGRQAGAGGRRRRRATTSPRSSRTRRTCASSTSSRSS